MNTMAEVLAEHVILSGGGWFACSNPECEWKLRNTLRPREFHASSWPVREFAAHQAAALSAAGFGPVREAQAQALRDAAEAIDVQRDASNPDRKADEGWSVVDHRAGRFLGKTVAARMLRARAASLGAG